MAARRKPATAANTAGNARRKRRSPDEIREKLVRAAREEFRRSGFGGATTAAIARKADVTEAQLFRYFASKADLFREAVFEPLNEHFAEFNARYPTSHGTDDNVRDQAIAYITELQQFLDEHSRLLLSLMVAQTFTSGSLQGIGEVDSLRAYFERGASLMTGRVGEYAQVDPRLLVRVSFAAVLGCVMFRDWIFPPGFASDRAITDAIIDFVIDGIAVNHDPGLQSSNTKPRTRKNA